MDIFHGKSSSGSVAEAAKGLGSAKLIIMTTTADEFEKNVAELSKMFPGVPSISCVGMGYDTSILEKGVFITAFKDGVTVATGVLEKVSVSPARYISRIEKDIEAVRPG